MTESDQQGLFERAREGNAEAFAELVAPYRSELCRHSYRMLGSTADADDVVQDTLLRAWHKLNSLDQLSSLRAWLYQIATHRSLDLLRSAPRRREVVNSADEPMWLQPFPEHHAESEALALEDIGLAFVTALQKLPGRQRSALLLTDVVGFSASEAAGILEMSTTAVHSATQRARATLAAAKAPQRASSDVDRAELVSEFIAAWQSGQPEQLISLLERTALLTMPPHRLEFRGEEIAFLLLDEKRFALHDQVEFVRVRANGEFGFATYIRSPTRRWARAHCVMLFGDSVGRASKITGFTESAVFDLLKLPMER